MKMTKADLQRTTRSTNPDARGNGSWEKTPERLESKSGARPAGYPGVRPYHPPTQAERLAEEPERWDGLS